VPAPPRSGTSLLSRAAATLVAAALLASMAGPAPADVPASPGARTHVVHDRRSPMIRVPRTFFGLHDASQQAYGRVRFGSLRLWDSGVTWRDVETAPGVYDWTRLDSLVSSAQAHRVQVTLVLGMTPSFYADAATLPPDRLTHFADYVRAVMTRYRRFDGRRGIAAYQVWNEGNISTFWTGTPAQLAELTRTVHHVGAEVDPGATIVAPSFAVRLPYQRQWFARYQSQRLHGAPVWHYYDANALSLYPMPTHGHRTAGPEDAMALLGPARARLARAGVPHRIPLWVSEINYGVRTGTPGQAAAQPITRRRQVANVIRTYLLGAAHRLSRVFWYRYDWNELPASSGGGTLGNTLLTVPGSPDQVTPAGRALATTVAWLHGRLVGRGGRRPCARSGSGLYTCVIRYSGGVRRIYWNPRHGERVQLPAHASYRQLAFGDVHRVGRSDTSVHVSYQPVMVDSPR
jgi:hypothetical protein